MPTPLCGLFESDGSKVKVGVLRPVQQPGSYWDRSSELPLVGLEPTVSLMGGVKFEEFKQDKVDQREALLNSGVFEESDDEEYEKMKHEDVNIQWLKN